VAVTFGSEARATIELTTGAQHFVLRPFPRPTSRCTASGRDGTLPSDAVWPLQQAAQIAIQWLRRQHVRVPGMLAHPHGVLSADAAHAAAARRDRVFRTVELHRKLTGRRLNSAAALHAYLIGAIATAGASGLLLQDVVLRSAPEGPEADAASAFAYLVDVYHRTAHTVLDATERRETLIGLLIDALAVVNEHDLQSSIGRALCRYLDCALGRKRVVVVV
jgi:hypothetical protein